MRGSMSPCPAEEGSGLGCIQCRSRSPDGGHLSSPQGSLAASRATRKEESSCQCSSGERRLEEGQEQGEMQAKVTLYICWRAAAAQLGPELTSGDTHPSVG